MNAGSLLPGHFFMSSSGPLGTWARCECGHDLPWDGRDAAHAYHVLAVVWEEGFQDGAAYGAYTDRHLEREGAENGEPHECKRCPVKTNPYEEE